MKKLLLLSLALLSGVSFAAGSVPPSIEVARAEFGLFDASGDATEIAFAPSKRVPLRVGQRYGWVIELAKAPRTLSVREEYVQPIAAQPAADPVSESLNVPLQRRNMVSQRHLAPIDGRIYGEWSVGANEPAGHRRLDVVIEGRVAASFEFDVE